MGKTQDIMRAHPVHIYLRRHAEWFPGEQIRAARKVGPNRAAFGRAAKHLQATSTAAPQSPTQPRAVLTIIPAPPLQVDSFGPLTAPLAALLPELRRKDSSAEIKAKAEKTSAAIYFDYPGTRALLYTIAYYFTRRFLKTRHSPLVLLPGYLAR
jgi:hypothetical protein